MLDIFGPNVATVEGRHWQRHRKITVAPFNESNYKLAWVEALKQSKDMLDWWMQHGKSGLKSTAKDTRALSLNILAYIGYKKQYPFDGAQKLSETGHAASFRGALSIVLDNALLTLVMSPGILKMLPRRWSRVGHAISALKSHMADLYNEETRSDGQSSSSCSGTLMGSMVAASRSTGRKEAAFTAGQSQPAREGLSISEIFGNVFVYYC